MEIVFLSIVDGLALHPDSRVEIDPADVLLLIGMHLLSKWLIASEGQGVQSPVEYPE